MIKLTWLSHGSWLIEHAEHRILLDPFLTENPTATSKIEDFEDVSHILISHGHFDHVADAAAIANRAGAVIVSVFEITQWFTNHHGVKSTVGMNLGGKIELPFGVVQMVPALHSSLLPDGTDGGTASGFVLMIESKRIYFACDTAFFSDMKHYAGGVDVAVLPIGDLFTMGIDESLAAIKRIEPKRVLPAHYNTWPPIAADANAWAERVENETNAQPVVLEVGGTLEI